MLRPRSRQPRGVYKLQIVLKRFGSGRQIGGLFNRLLSAVLIPKRLGRCPPNFAVSTMRVTVST